ATSRRQAAVALATLAPELAAKRVVELLNLPDAGDPAPLFEALLQRKNGAAVLAAALDGKQIPADVAKVGIRALQTTAREAPALVEALTKAGSLTTGPRTLSPDEMRRAVADVAQHGDAARGERIFRRK